MQDLIFDGKHEAINKKSFWKAKLSDGRIIYEDCRRGLPSAWSRLHKFLHENKNVQMTELTLTYGGQCVKIQRNHPQDFDGFYFSNRVVAVLGGRQATGRIVGLVRGPKAYVVRLEEDGKKYEDIVDYKTDDPRVILDVQ